MAYARFARDCDVYVYADSRGGYTCERCPKIGEAFRSTTAAEMVTHLLDQHRAKGHRVPDYAIEALSEAPRQKTVAVVWAADRKRKAEIVEREDGLFQVRLYREVEGEGESEPDVHWSPIGRHAILTDTLERAKTVAEDELRS